MHDSVISELAQGILAHLKRRHWLKPGDRLGVAVSGGADSVALLRALSFSPASPMERSQHELTSTEDLYVLHKCAR